MYRFSAIILVVLLISTVSYGQQPGEIGVYQGCKLVKGKWVVSALFADYQDAREWVVKQTGTSKVVDQNGLLIFVPAIRRIETPTDVLEPAPPLAGRPFKWIRPPGPGAPRTRIPGENP